MNLPGLWQLKTNLYLYKDIPADHMECPRFWEIGIWNFENWNWKNWKFWRAVFNANALAALSLAHPFPAALELGINFVAPPLSPEGTPGQQIKSNQALQNSRPAHRHCTWPLQLSTPLCVLRVCFFPLWTPREADLTDRSQLRTQSCPPRHLVASTILSRWCAENRPGCQKVFNPFFPFFYFFCG